MNLKALTQEQWDKLRECKTPEDILALAQAEGVELTDDQLQRAAAVFVRLAVTRGLCSGDQRFPLLLVFDLGGGRAKGQHHCQVTLACLGVLIGLLHDFRQVYYRQYDPQVTNQIHLM